MQIVATNIQVGNAASTDKWQLTAL